MNRHHYIAVEHGSTVWIVDLSDPVRSRYRWHSDYASADLQAARLNGEEVGTVHESLRDLPRGVSA